MTRPTTYFRIPLLLLLTLPTFASAGSERANIRATDLLDMPDRYFVTFADGIDREEASRIGGAYFKRHVVCGAFDGISDGGSHWRVEGTYGFGTPIRGFTIDKQTGEITLPVELEHRDTKALLGADYHADTLLISRISAHE